MTDPWRCAICGASALKHEADTEDVICVAGHRTVTREIVVRDCVSLYNRKSSFQVNLDTSK